MAGQRVLLKDQLFNSEKIASIAAELHDVHRAFDADAFVDDATSRLPQLELKQRIAWITDCLEKHLPGDYRRAADVIMRSLPDPCDPAHTDGDFGDFIYAPYGEYIARHGCTRADLTFSLAALRDLTTRFSAEFAIRPFVGAFPEDTLQTLTEWAGDEHYHVRRLCSEGTRPKLPWAKRLTTPVGFAIPLLDRLYSDPTRYVTRSVANHVNDISTLDPGLAVDLLQRWRSSDHQDKDEMDYIVRHASRSLARRADPVAMALLGIPAGVTVEMSNLTIADQVELGSALQFSFTVTALVSTEVVAEYVIRYPGSNEDLTRGKVYTIQRGSLAAGQQITLSRAHPLPAAMTTRAVRPGRHEIEIRLNGRSLARAQFWVTAAHA